MNDLNNFISRLLEGNASIVEEYANYVDSREPCYDSPGTWVPTSASPSLYNSPVYTEAFFDQIRNESRELCMRNPFAINAIENRVNYVVGKGHKYHIVPNSEASITLAKKVQSVVDRFIEDNQWYKRQQEIMRRKDRDGEAFLRFFCDSQGNTTIRFIEPEQIRTPIGVTQSYFTNLGVKTKENDVESVQGYWIDDEYVTADKIQHRKGFVDFNIKRGIPALYAVYKNMIRAEKLLRNMSVVAEIQSAIALIRKHASGSVESIQKYVQNNRSGNVAWNDGGRQKFLPGTIIDAQSGTDYEFPIAAIDASRYIQILQAELRAIASRLVMPEFMLSSDASNSNYSSTMVAEGPAVRMFERLQTDMIEEDKAVLRRTIDAAIAFQKLPRNVLELVTLQIIPPTLAVRDRYDEIRADEILLKHGVISPQTMALRYGLNPEKESWLQCHCQNQTTDD